jgi:hypothetical protein
MDVHSIGGPQRSAKSFYSSQSPFNRDRQLKHPIRPGGPAASIDRRDCGGANSLLLQRGHGLSMAAGQRASLRIPRIRARTATLRRAKIADFRLWQIPLKKADSNSL